MFKSIFLQVGHTDYVAAVAYGPSAPLPQGSLISGSRDTTVGIWDLNTAAMVHQLSGHKYDVPAVGVTPHGAVVSVSLDGTGKVWHGGECTGTLQGHESAVNSLAVLPDDSGNFVATGSSDKTIRIWSVSDAKCTKVIPAHDDTVRSLAVVPGIGIVSGSHDTTLKVWTLNWDCIAQMSGHSGIVYSVGVSPDSAFISSGSEDNTARVWQLDGTCCQVIEHPGCVWSTVFLANGDLVTACSDGVARVWSRDPERHAGAQEVEIYAAALTAFKEAAKSSANKGDEGAGWGLPPGFKLQDPSALQAPGGKDGQTIIVKQGNSGMAYQWSAAKVEWELIGEVVSGPEGGSAAAGGGSKKVHDGQEWDYVFDVDVADGAQPLKLAMNADENPYLVADRFIEAYELPAQFKEQIVQFIMQNTGGSSSGASAPPGAYVDPFTGASAYVPPATQSAPRAAPGAQLGAATGGGVDPFTGRSAAANQHLPARAFLLFDAPPPAEGLRKKMGEFNSALASDPSSAALAVEGAQMAEGGALERLLTAAATPAQAGRVFDGEGITSLLPLLLRWPPAQLFPCLDLARVVMLDAQGAAWLAESAAEPTLDAAEGSLGRALAVACTSDPPVPASQQVALRCIANCYAQPALQVWARTHMLSLLGLVAPCASSSTKGVRLGMATFLVNVALALTKLPGHELEGKTQVVALAAALLRACPPEDTEPRYRYAQYNTRQIFAWRV